MKTKHPNFLRGYGYEVLYDVSSVHAGTVADVRAGVGTDGSNVRDNDSSRNGGMTVDDRIDCTVGLVLSSIGRAEKLSELARMAGRTTSPAKAAAARANGAQGGRPRKG